MWLYGIGFVEKNIREKCRVKTYFISSFHLAEFVYARNAHSIFPVQEIDDWITNIFYKFTYEYS